MTFWDSLYPLWAVHISDGVLTTPWLVGGFVLLGGLLAAAVAIDKVRARWGQGDYLEEEIAQVALLTAVFFVASLVHVRLGPTSAHLLLNGLVGVILGWRAALAIPIGLLFQVVLIGHGGYSTLGINSCVLVLPALLAWVMLRGLHRVSWLRHPWGRGLLVAVSVLSWLIFLLYSVVLLWTNPPGQFDDMDLTIANHVLLSPLTLLVLAGIALAMAYLERRLEHTPEFPLGLMIGVVTVLATSLLNGLVLLWGGQEDWHTLVLLVFVAHLPIAVLEGIVLGFTVGFLARVKPRLLGWQVIVEPFPTPNIAEEKEPCTADSLS